MVKCRKGSRRSSEKDEVQFKGKVLQEKVLQVQFKGKEGRTFFKNHDVVQSLSRV